MFDQGHAFACPFFFLFQVNFTDCFIVSLFNPLFK